MPGTALIRLVAALLHDKRMRRRFNEEPRQLIDEFGLTAAEEKALFSMERTTITNAVSANIAGFLAEIGSIPVDPKEFPPSGEDWMEELDKGHSEYPTPLPMIRRIRPRKTSLADLPFLNPADKKFVITIVGQSFRPDGNLGVSVNIIGSQNSPWDLTSSLTGTMRCSKLMAVMAPAGGAPSIPIGKYRVTVQNNGADLVRTTDPTKHDFEVTA